MMLHASASNPRRHGCQFETDNSYRYVTFPRPKLQVRLPIATFSRSEESSSLRGSWGG